jgi:hypothetical protein
MLGGFVGVKGSSRIIRVTGSCLLHAFQVGITPCQNYVRRLIQLKISCMCLLHCLLQARYSGCASWPSLGCGQAFRYKWGQLSP